MRKRMCLSMLLSVILLSFSSCATANSIQNGSGVINRTPSKDLKSRFYIYNDTHPNDFLPVSWMGAAPTACSLDAACSEKPVAGSSCLKIEVTSWGSPYWAAIGWTVPGPEGKGKPYWGKEPAPGWDLKGARKLVFSARASQDCQIEVKTMAFGDATYGDSSSFGLMKKVALTKDWKSFEFDLTKEDLSRVICGLVIALNSSSINAPTSIWLDEVYFQFPIAAVEHSVQSSKDKVLYDDKHQGVSPVDWMPEEAGQMVVLDPAFKPDSTKKNTCIKMILKEWRSPYWCAIAWVVDSESNSQPYWGDAPREAWDLNSFDELHFRAKANRPIKVQFKIGILGDKPYGDSIKTPIQSSFIKVSDQWKDYAVKLKDKPLNLSRIVTPFCVVFARDQQLETPLILLLDDIKFITINKNNIEKK